MIRVEGLTKAYGDKVAVADVSLEVQKGEILGLVGPDGAGKTTLLRMVCGLLTPDGGEVFLKGKNLRELERCREDLGYMPQRFSLYEDLTVMENILFFGSLYGLPRRTILARAEEILSLTAMLEFKARLAAHLSGGMRQKLALTCALITRPAILVLDEPTYGVDPESRKEFWKILYYLNKEGMTLLISTPYMDEAELCHRVAFINKGRLAVTGMPQELKAFFPYHLLEVRAAGIEPDFFKEIEGIEDVSYYGDRFRLMAQDPDACRREIAARLSLPEQEAELAIREVPPGMEDVFVWLAERGGKV